jgi:hypothetical protein
MSQKAGWRQTGQGGELLPRKKKERASDGKSGRPSHETHRVRLPGFLIDEEIGLGDAIERVTYAIGVKPCGGCEKRAAALNQWMHFTR